MAKKPKIQKSKFKLNEITLVIIIVIVAVFVSVYNKSKEPKESEAKRMMDILSDGHKVSFITGNTIDEEKFKEIQSASYEEIKKLLNTNKDFCIYIEDGDGNILLAKGPSKLSKDGIVCKK